MHFVHVTPQGTPRAVLAFRIDPGNADSTFFARLPEMISYRDINKTVDSSINPMMAVNEVANFSEFWTYRGKSPKYRCTRCPS
jgi:carbonic anhydrase